MKSPNLSKKAIDFLGDNGYSYKHKDGQLSIKKTVGYLGAIILIFVSLFLSIPLFAAGVAYGVGLIVLVVGGIIIQKVFFSKPSSLTVDLNTNKFSAKVGTYFQEDQPLSMISQIKLASKFVDEYTTAARNSVEEHLITISIQLITKEEIILFHFKSDQAEPNEQINEVYALLETAVKSAKNS